MASTTRKKVLFIHHARTLGGATTSMLNIVRYLDRNKFNPKILFIFENPFISDLCKKENIEFKVLKSVFFKRFYNINAYSEANRIKWTYQLRIYPFIRDFISWVLVAFYFSGRIIRAENPEIIHLNSAFLTDWLWGARKIRAKKIVHVREPLSSRGFGMKRYFYKFMLGKYADRIIAISIDNKKRLGLPKNTEVVYNFMPEPKFTNLKKAPGIVNVIYLGGDAKIKGFEILKLALPLLNPGIMVLVAGYFSNPGCLNNYKNVEYLGVVTNVYDHIIRADILIFPSIFPHFAKPIIEAGMCKLPVIASNVDGMEEIVNHGLNGFLFPNGNAQELANSINLFAANLKLRQEYGRNNFEMVKNKFSIEPNLKLIERIYLC